MTQAWRWPTAPTIIAVSMVVSVASFMRFWPISQGVIFTTDHARAALAGRNILLGQWLWGGPPTSVNGINLGPLFYYWEAVGLWVSRFDPIGPALLTASLGVVTCILLFMWQKYWWGREIALWGGLFLALSPLAARQAGIAVEPAPLPLIVMLWLIATSRALTPTSAMARHSGGKWLKRLSGFFSLFLPLVAMQLNFSGVLLWPITLLAWWWLSSPISNTTKRLALFSSMLLAGLLLLIKDWWRGRTPLLFFWQQWQNWTTPDNLISALLLLMIAMIVVGHLTRQAWPSDHPPRALPTLIMAWFTVSGSAFLLKTVGGDHSLALVFLLPAVLLSLGFGHFSHKIPLWALNLGSITLLSLWAINSLTWLRRPHGLTVTDHAAVIELIGTLSQHEPYNLIYRGHLDIYDAADDHYQYLLWQAGYAPAASWRIAAEPTLAERWLLTWQPDMAKRTIYIYNPAERAAEYTDTRPGVRVGDVLLVVEER